MRAQRRRCRAHAAVQYCVPATFGQRRSGTLTTVDSGYDAGHRIRCSPRLGTRRARRAGIRIGFCSEKSEMPALRCRDESAAARPGQAGVAQSESLPSLLPGGRLGFTASFPLRSQSLCLPRRDLATIRVRMCDLLHECVTCSAAASVTVSRPGLAVLRRCQSSLSPRLIPQTLRARDFRIRSAVEVTDSERAQEPRTPSRCRRACPGFGSAGRRPLRDLICTRLSVCLGGPA